MCGSREMRLDLMQTCDAPCSPSNPCDFTCRPSNPCDFTCIPCNPCDVPCRPSNPVTGPTAGSGDSPVAVSVANTHKMKEWMQKSSRLGREESPPKKGKEQ